MEFHRQQRFSIRKYAIGVASVLIGTFLMGSDRKSGSAGKECICLV